MIVLELQTVGIRQASVRHERQIWVQKSCQVSLKCVQLYKLTETHARTLLILLQLIFYNFHDFSNSCCWIVEIRINIVLKVSVLQNLFLKQWKSWSMAKGLATWTVAGRSTDWTFFISTRTQSVPLSTNGALHEHLLNLLQWLFGKPTHCRPGSSQNALVPAVSAKLGHHMKI